MYGLLGALVLSGGAVGCAAEQGVDEDVQNEPEVLASTESPNTLTFAKVTANGTGCPAGTWEAVSSKDGKHYSLKFKSFVGKVDREATVSVKECQLGISINTPEDSSVALESFKIGGWASLSRGTSAVVLTKAYFQGKPTEAAETKHEFTGTRLSRLGIAAKTEADDLVWSPCGKERDLNVRTTVRVKGDGHRGTVSIDELESLQFAVKKCGDDKPTDPDENNPDPDENNPDPDENEPSADGPGIVTVKALGTGCPAEKSSVELAKDRLKATVTYSEFGAVVDENKSVEVKNCQLGIVFRNMDKFRYSVTSTLTGGAYLEEGQSAKILQSAYIQGAPTGKTEIASDLVGPFDDHFTSEALLSNTVTSCGPARDLNVNTTVRLANAEKKKPGYVELSRLNGHGGQVITVTATPCE